MDPISHALIGAAVSAAGQNSVSLSNPVIMAATLGSVIPDGDFILQIWGDSFYLKHHRGASHSLIGIVFEALGIAFMMKVFNHDVSFFSMLIWAFIGAMTHIIADVFNSYGAKIFWPFSNKKNSLSLFTLADPVIIILSVVSILDSYNKWGYNGYVLILFILYIGSKVFMRILGHSLLKKKFAGMYEIERINILPSMVAGYKLHYIVEGPLYKIVGEIDFLFRRIKIIDTLKRIDTKTREFILRSKSAEFFKEFTPIFHIELEKVNDGYKAMLTDLRYMFKNNFLHHATINYDENMVILSEKFNPYNMNKQLDI